MSLGRKVYNKELNRFVIEIEIKLSMDDLSTDEILNLWDFKTLERLLRTQIKHENYEAAATIKKHIDAKKTCVSSLESK